MKTTTKTYVICALCTAIICVLAPLAIPIGPVPLSLATLAVMFTSFLLGWKWGTVAVVLYLVLGAVGVPVFSGFSAGFAKLAGPTGGYLIGYIPLALLCGLFYDFYGRRKSGWKKYAAMAAGVIVGTIVLYALGTAWFCIQANASLETALPLCVIPFLPGDVIKGIICLIIVPVLEKALIKAHILIRDKEASA